MASLPGVPLPISPGVRTALPHSMTTRFRPDAAQKRRLQRPVSCVIPDPATPGTGTPGSQVVVVSQGPRNLYRSSSTPKVFGTSSGKWREDPQWEVYQLEHRVPKFEPLAKWRDLEGCDPTPVS